MNNIKMTENKDLQEKRMKELCYEKGVDYNSLKLLLESCKTKKLLRRNNFHLEKINEVVISV